MTTDPDDKNFLDRWSRRKAEVRARESDPLPEIEEESASGALVDQGEESDEPDGSELTEEDVAKLDVKSDFTVFMKAAVPAEIRRMALKKLWHLDPAYNIVDGLVEYGEDYSMLHKNVGKIESAYQVGKGYVFDEEEDEEIKVEEPKVAARQSELSESENSASSDDLAQAEVSDSAVEDIGDRESGPISEG